MMSDLKAKKYMFPTNPSFFGINSLFWGIKPLQGSRKLFTNHYEKNGEKCFMSSLSPRVLNVEPLLNSGFFIISNGGLVSIVIETFVKNLRFLCYHHLHGDVWWSFHSWKITVAMDSQPTQRAEIYLVGPVDDAADGRKKKEKRPRKLFLMFLFFLQVVRVFLLLEVCVFWTPPCLFFVRRLTS